MKPTVLTLLILTALLTISQIVLIRITLIVQASVTVPIALRILIAQTVVPLIRLIALILLIRIAPYQTQLIARRTLMVRTVIHKIKPTAQLIQAILIVTLQIRLTAPIQVTPLVLTMSTKPIRLILIPRRVILRILIILAKMRQIQLIVHPM